MLINIVGDGIQLRWARVGSEARAGLGSGWWLGLGLGRRLGKIWDCVGAWVMSAAGVSARGLRCLGVQHAHPHTHPANLSPACSQIPLTLGAQGWEYLLHGGSGCKAGEPQVRKTGRRPGARGLAGSPGFCHLEGGDPASGTASSFSKASALLPSLEANQGGSCRPCVTPGQERPPWQGKALVRPGRDVNKQKWDLGPRRTSSQAKWEIEEFHSTAVSIPVSLGPLGLCRESETGRRELSAHCSS